MADDDKPGASLDKILATVASAERRGEEEKKAREDAAKRAKDEQSAMRDKLDGRIKDELTPVLEQLAAKLKGSRLDLSREQLRFNGTPPKLASGNVEKVARLTFNLPGDSRDKPMICDLVWTLGERGSIVLLTALHHNQKAGSLDNFTGDAQLLLGQIKQDKIVEALEKAIEKLISRKPIGL